VVVADRLVIAAPDRSGLLAAAAGVLCLAGLDVRSADARTIDGIAVDEFDVVPGPRGLPAPESLAASLEDALADRLDLAEAIASRAHAYRRSGAARTSVMTTVDQSASALATVVEVRAPDRIGLLWRLADTITANGLTVGAARAVSLGHEAVDVFYVRTAEGSKLVGAALDALLADLAAAGAPEPLEPHPD
jgi:[protein-PII] uridylyltransferase